MDVEIRQAIPNDINFIFSTWLKSYRKSSFVGEKVENKEFFNNYNQIIDNLLLKSTTYVACLKDDEIVICGYICAQDDIIHYIFVKEVFRNLGIARKLIKHMEVPPTYTTHLTRMSEGLLVKFNLKYNPFLLFQGGNYGSRREEIIES